MNGAYTNNKLIFTYLDRLYEYERLLYNAKQIKIDECKEKLLSCEKDSFSSEIVMEHFNEFHELAEKFLESTPCLISILKTIKIWKNMRKGAKKIEY